MLCGQSGNTFACEQPPPFFQEKLASLTTIFGILTKWPKSVRHNYRVYSSSSLKMKILFDHCTNSRSLVVTDSNNKWGFKLKKPCTLTSMPNCNIQNNIRTYDSNVWWQELTGDSPKGTLILAWKQLPLTRTHRIVGPMAKITAASDEIITQSDVFKIQ